MIEEWFHSKLSENGHIALHKNYRVRVLSTEQIVLDKLRSLWEGIEYFSVDAHEAFSKSIMNYLIDNSLIFDKWTTFRSDDKLYFVFSNAQDAVMFKLLWHDLIP